MAQFESAFEAMIKDEGGYQLITLVGDTGGMTYAGIARNPNPQWPGWALVDRKDFGGALTGMVRDFYRTAFWDRIKGDQIASQEIASSIFKFAVNTGAVMAIKLAQPSIGATPDGGGGPKTLTLLNGSDPAIFRKSYAVAKITRYAEICNRNRDQSRFLLGWINRTLRGAA